MNEQRDTAHKFAKTNPKREADKKIALDMYAALSKPIDSYLDSIVTSTGLKLRDVIDNYWFKTPQGLYVTTHYESFTWLI